VLAALPLLWPALYNGYPLVFSDTGTYLSQAIQHYLGWDRPVFYSLFLLPLHLTLTTWPVVVAQALLTAHLLHLTRRVLLPLVSDWWLVPFSVVLALATALPWFVAEIMPDLFTGLLVLTFGLLACAPHALSGRERIWLTLLAAFMIAAHLSHLPLVLALLPVALAVRYRLGLLTPKNMVPLLLPPILAGLALVGVNLAGHHRASLSPYGNLFLLNRVIYDGPGLRALRQDCPDHTWRLCPYLASFPSDPDMFLWRSDGPVALAGGAKLVSAEAGAIIAAAVTAEPGTELRAMLENTRQQLGMFATGDGLTAWPQTVTPWIRRDFPPAEAARYDAARQTTGQALVPNWLGLLHWWIALAGVAACFALLPWAWAQRHVSAGFLALALLTLPANAFITGALSGPHDRYQSRVMWLPPLVAALALPAMLRRAA
jgi:hypothetical protein